MSLCVPPAVLHIFNQGIQEAVVEQCEVVLPPGEGHQEGRADSQPHPELHPFPPLWKQVAHNEEHIARQCEIGRA